MCGFYFHFDKGQLKKEWEEAQKKTSGYHIHIYARDDAAPPAEFGPMNSIAAAWAIADQLSHLFPEAVTHMSGVGVVGPHSRRNVEIDIAPERFGEVVAWLQQNNDGLSILIHPDTGDDRKDHLQAAMWIGEPVPFNPAFFGGHAPASPRHPKGPASDGPRT